MHVHPSFWAKAKVEPCAKFEGVTVIAPAPLFVKILYSPTVVPSAKLTARAEPLLPIIKVAAVLAAPFDVIVEELNAALFNSTEPVPFGVIIIFKLDAPPVAESVGPVVDAPVAIVGSLTALPVVVNFINSFPFASFKEVQITGVLIVGEVSVLLVKVCEPAIVAIVPAPLGIVMVPPFVIDAMVGVVKVLLVKV